MYGIWCDSEHSLFCLLVNTGSDPGASSYFWTHRTDYLQQILETLFFTGTRGIFTSKNCHILVCTDKDEMDNHSLSDDSHTLTDLHFLLLYILRYKFNPTHKVAVHFCVFPNYKTNLKIITFGLIFAKSTFKNQRHKLLLVLTISYKKNLSHTDYPFLNCESGDG